MPTALTIKLELLENYSRVLSVWLERYTTGARAKNFLRKEAILGLETGSERPANI